MWISFLPGLFLWNYTGAQDALTSLQIPFLCQEKSPTASFQDVFHFTPCACTIVLLVHLVHLVRIVQMCFHIPCFPQISILLDIYLGFYLIDVSMFLLVYIQQGCYKKWVGELTRWCGPWCGPV